MSDRSIPRETAPGDASSGPRADAFSILLASLSLRCVVAGEISFNGSWTHKPDPRSAGVALITGGGCLLRQAELPAVRLSAGDVLLWPAASDTWFENAAADILATDASTNHWPQYSDPFGDARIIFSSVEAPHPARDPFFGLLNEPAVFKAPAGNEPPLARLAACLAALVRDAAAHRLIRDRLAEVLLFEALRLRLAAGDSAPPGWFRAVADPEIGPILAEMIRHPERDWTVAMLAELGAMSRSTFARRFAEVMHCGPIDCLVDIRMRRACERLAGDRPDLKLIARSAGYRSAAAFSAAFKRWCGLTPSEFRNRRPT